MPESGQIGAFKLSEDFFLKEVFDRFFLKV
jgi:hypothetical protein